MLTMSRRSFYVTVARRGQWTLAWPRHKWERLTPGEQREVVKRQQVLFEKMARAKQPAGNGRPSA